MATSRFNPSRVSQLKDQSSILQTLDRNFDQIAQAMATLTATLSSITLNAPLIINSTTVSPGIMPFGTSSGTITNGQTFWLDPWAGPFTGALTATIPGHPAPMPFAGKLSNMFMFSLHGTTGCQQTYTIQKNGLLTPLTITVGAGINLGHDTVHSVSFAQGDLITCALTVTAGGSVSAANISVTVEVTQA
jgi:hypothetical protein